MHAMRIAICRGREVLRALRRAVVHGGEPGGRLLSVPSLRFTACDKFEVLRAMRPSPGCPTGSGGDEAGGIVYRRASSGDGRTSLPQVRRRLSAEYQVLRAMRRQY